MHREREREESNLSVTMSSTAPKVDTESRKQYKIKNARLMYLFIIQNNCPFKIKIDNLGR